MKPSHENSTRSAVNSVSCIVNGEPVSVQVKATDTMLTILREELLLTGTKRGCNQGVCGACTILVNDLPMRGCLLLAASCNGRTITTVEGVAGGNGKKPSAIQSALVETGGLQCGFCTPGMVMALTAFLKENPKPTREEVRHALSGNLCRCTGYTKIVDAAMMVAEGADL